MIFDHNKEILGRIPVQFLAVSEHYSSKVYIVRKKVADLFYIKDKNPLDYNF